MSERKRIECHISGFGVCPQWREQEKEIARLREENERHLETIRQQQDNSVAISEYAEQVRRERDEARALLQSIHLNVDGWKRLTLDQCRSHLEMIFTLTIPYREEKPDPGTHVEPAAWNPEFTNLEKD